MTVTQRASASTPRTDRLDVTVVGGAGHVGLPLSLTFAAAGMRVGIFDIAQDTLDRVAAGEMPFVENGAEELLQKVGKSARLNLSRGGSEKER